MMHGRTESTSADSPVGFMEQYETLYENDPDYIAEGLALQITEEASRLMGDASISRSALAELMGVSRSYVTRIFNAPPNLTLRSIAQLAIALGVKPRVTFAEQPATPTMETPVVPVTITVSPDMLTSWGAFGSVAMSLDAAGRWTNLLNLVAPPYVWINAWPISRSSGHV